MGQNNCQPVNEAPRHRPTTTTTTTMVRWRKHSYLVLGTLVSGYFLPEVEFVHYRYRKSPLLTTLKVSLKWTGMDRWEALRSAFSDLLT